MRKTTCALLGFATLMLSCIQGPVARSCSLTLAFSGPSTSSNTVYVAWVEDEEGNNLQNLYVCNKLIYGGLTGTANPYWKREKYPGSDVDGLCGASVQGAAGLSVTRDLLLRGVSRFRVCFEIDRSWNGNDYFYDRPSFTYRSGLIDLFDLEPEYDLSIYGWMSNDSTGNSLGQQPKDGMAIPGWAAWKFITEADYIAPHDDMVSSLKVVVAR